MTAICWLGLVLMMTGFAPLYQNATTTKTAKTTKSEKTTPTKNATDAQIATAKAAGLVWVNLATKVYHDSSSEFYGATKSGKFMNEQEAAAAGYHKAKNEK
jgi:hypothetical protein